MGKGGGFEREVAVLLSRWWEPGRDDIFWRSDSSGARYTQRKKSGKDTALQGGDITCADPCGELLIRAWNMELKTGYGGCKKVKDSDGKLIKKVQKQWDLLDILDSSKNTPVFFEFWNQCFRDAKLTGRKPILIFRRNLRKICISYPMAYHNHLQDYFGPCMSPTILSTTVEENIIILLLADFFQWIPDIRAALPKPGIRKFRR